MKTFKTSCFAVLSLLSINVHAWSRIIYVANTTGFWGPTTHEVYPTGPVTPTSSFVTTTTWGFDLDGETSVGNIPITETTLFLGPNASTYSGALNVFGSPPPTTTATTATTAIGTSIYGPAVVSNPASCTVTAFTYTTVHSVGMAPEFSTQALESINAAYITSFGGVYSTDLGGQPVHTLYTAVYLRPEVVGGLLPVEADEQHYLSECVDPRRYLCTKYNRSFPVQVAATGGCPVPTTSETYPPFMSPEKTASTSTTSGPAATASATAGGTKANVGPRTWDGPVMSGGVVVLLAILCVIL